jgi:glucosamine-6-phosphate deaminase
MIRTRSADEFAGAAADLVTEQLRHAQSVLTLPTGNTPVRVYAELVRRSRAGLVSFDSARIFDLDEYCGLPPADPHSYAAFMDRHLVAPLGLPARQVRLWRGDAADLDAECRDYDKALGACGGIDLCVLGLGTNGHIAFNEPGSSWELRTHVVELSPSTRAQFERQAAPSREVPSHGLTLGIRNVLEARRILLLIAGAHKSAARDALYEGKEDLDWPVTSLLRHTAVTVIELCEPVGSP